MAVLLDSEVGTLYSCYRSRSRGRGGKDSGQGRVEVEGRVAGAGEAAGEARAEGRCRVTVDMVG